MEEKECVMRTYLKNIKHITSLMAFIAALLVSMSFATVSNAVVVPGNPVIGNPVAVNAVVPPVGVKVVNAVVNPGLGSKAFGLGARPFGLGLGVRPLGFGFGLGARPFGFGFNPFFNRPFFGADFDDVGVFGADFD